MKPGAQRMKSVVVAALLIDFRAVEGVAGRLGGRQILSNRGASSGGKVAVGRCSQWMWSAC
jgi:hypothetical protein